MYIEVGEMKVQCIECPGHSWDHFAFKWNDSLFCGDLILGEGSTVIDHLDSYLDSLNKVKVLVEAVDI